VAFALALAQRQAFRARDIEAHVHQGFDQMHREPGMDRIVAWPLRLEEALAILNVPVGKMRIGLVLRIAVADGVAEIDRKGRSAVLAIAFVLVVAP